MNDYYEIGSRETVLGGVVFKSGQTDQGVVYKSERAFKEKQGICYIPECAFENEELLITVDTLPGLLLDVDIETYDSIREQVRTSIIDAHVFKDEPVEMRIAFLDHLTQCVFDIVDWQCVSSYINADLDIEEAFEYFKEDYQKSNDPARV